MPKDSTLSLSPLLFLLIFHLFYSPHQLEPGASAYTELLQSLLELPGVHLQQDVQGDVLLRKLGPHVILAQAELSQEFAHAVGL